MKRVVPPLIALFVGAITLVFTVGLCVHERQSEQSRLRAIFDASARRTAGRIEERVANYEQMLRGVQGLFSTVDVVDRREFTNYVDVVMSGPDATGLVGIAYGRLVHQDERAAFEQQRRLDGAPDFRIQPPGDRDVFAPITYLAPDSPSNLATLGFDVLSDPVRRVAMEQARDSGNVAFSGQVRLHTDTGPTALPSCLVVLPIYARGSDTGSVVARRVHGVGWVWLAFRVSDLMATLYGDGNPDLRVSLHDGADASDASLIYRSAPPDADADNGDRDGNAARAPRFQSQEYIAFAGHTWTLQLSSLPAFEREHQRSASSVILVSGIVLSLLLALITHQLVTARTRAGAVAQAMTRELRASEERYRRIVETAGEGIWLLDAERRIVFANPRILDWLRTTESEMLGRPVDAWMDADDAARCRAAFDAEPLDDSSEAVELRLRRRDGSTMWASLSLRPIFDDANRHSGSLGMLTDIDQRRLGDERRGALELQLRESQKMEAIGTLAGGIAHDFNNILAAIIGNVSTARQDAAIGLSADASLAQIERAAVRARSLVQQILTFSRMQAQALQTQALQPVVDETLEMLRAALPAQVELVVRLPAQPVIVRADATQIQQVVMNLCTNAWHALPAGHGRIEVGLDVETGAQSVRTSAASSASAMPPALLAGPRAHLWVADNGSGMDDATRARVFEPFFTTKQVGQGTGLGLAVVHGIVSVHGGAIHVDSSPGRGSRFDLWFPLQDAPLGEPDPTPSAFGTLGPSGELAPRGHGERVLCVDDDPAMVLMMDGLLQRAGYQVTVFDQPRAALAAAFAQPDAFDIVVTDFNMPDMNGMDLARALAHAAPTLPIIITSGFISDEMRQQASELKIGALLQKEYTLERLASLVDAVLGQREAS